MATVGRPSEPAAARYLELAQTEHEQRLGAELGRLFDEFTTLGHALIAAKDEQEGAFRIAGGNFEALDAIIDENLDRLDDEAPREQWRKLLLSLDLEADLSIDSIKRIEILGGQRIPR